MNGSILSQIVLLTVTGSSGMSAGTRLVNAGSHDYACASGGQCVDLPENGRDSAMASTLRTIRKPTEVVQSFFRLTFSQSGSSIAVIVAPNQVVTHSRLFALRVGRKLCYFGSRQTAFGSYDLLGARSDWNSALSILRNPLLVNSPTAARSLGVLLLAFVTGEPLAPRPGILEHELDMVEEPGGLELPEPDSLDGPTVVYQVHQNWVVSGKWQRWVFKMRFSAEGEVHDLTLEPQQ